MRIDREQADGMIGALLRAGVIGSASVVLAGAIWYLSRYGEAVPDFHNFRGEPRELCTAAGILGGAFDGQPRSLIQLGLLLLIATPIARVALSVVVFALERDRLYVVLTLIVLATLLGSLLWPV
jgi:uncharacterized membrane protein